MPEAVRFGVIGTSWLEDLRHLPALESHPRAEVAAICGRNAERARSLAVKHAIAATFTDYREMLEKEHLDAVVIATPDDLHYPMTMDALDLGLHVLCEKPLASSAAQAREMYERAEAVGVKHAVGFTWRCLPSLSYLRELVAEGYLGRIYHCALRCLADYARGGRYQWRFDPRRANGILGDLGSHVIDLARLFVGEIARVNAHLVAPVPTAGPDGLPMQPANQSASLAVEFANGAQGTIHVSALAHLAGRGLEIRVRLYGEGGTLEADFESGGLEMEVRGARADEARFQTLPIPDRIWGDVVDRRDPLEWARGLPSIDRLLVDAIVNDRPMSPSFLDGLKAQEVVDAALASHERGAWEPVGGQG